MPYPQLAIDPSNNNLGVAVGLVDESNKTTSILFATTYDIKKLLKNQDKVLDTLSPRSQQVKLVKCLIKNLILFFDIEKVVTEKPVLGFGRSANPESHANQWESISAIRQAVLSILDEPHSLLSNDLEILPASKIKSLLGVPGNNGDKELITKALYEHIENKMLEYKYQEHKPNYLDEHGNDAVAILLAKVKLLP